MNSVRLSVFSLLGVATGTFAFLCLLTFWTGGSLLSADLVSGHVDYLRESGSSVLHSADEMGAIREKISNDQLLSKTISFYETIIQVLVGLIAAIGVVAFMYIRAASIDHAERIVEEAVKTRFEKNEFHELLKKYLSEQLDKEVSDIKSGLDQYMEDVDAKALEAKVLLLGDEVSNIRVGMTNILSMVANLDGTEREGRNIHLAEAEGDDNGNA